MKVNSQLERAQQENLSSLPSAATAGRFAWNTTDGKSYVDDASNWRALLRNDGKAVIGNNGTAASNTRLHRGAAAVLQIVIGSDVTAEGTLSTALAQISARAENYIAAGLPTFGNAGRVAYVTDTGFLNYDTGAAWNVLVDASTAQTISNKTLTTPVLAGFSGTIATDSAAGSDQTLSLPVSIVELTGALTSIAGITAPSTARLIIVTNLTGSDVVVKNDQIATAADRIVTGTGINITMANTSNIWLYYDTVNSRWRIVGGSGSGGGAMFMTGTRGSPNNIVAGTGVAYVSINGARQTWFVATASGEVTVSATPQITAGSVVGYELFLIGTSDDNYPTFHDGNGLALKGDWSGLLNSVLKLIWDGTNWVETGRI